ncbi:DUF11 domain-containing protein [Crenothrix polyspora]|uniref:Putative WD40 domain protein beta Propeller n=1 Tax=Crenothrix polyspora TaxID=360316 RepID=A0A1R4HAG1_9GAMM|nr:DUF11 domain-containing protein [Crenothrix polyspora]SJM92850.1 putative WD40 domain protein beta Propeller [Crenothrix polyspora]
MSSKTLYSSLFSGAALLCLLNGHVFAGQTTQVSVASNVVPVNTNGFYNPKMSADGRFVAFSSKLCSWITTPNQTTYQITDIFVQDQLTHKTERIISKFKGCLLNISADGRYISFIEQVPFGIAGIITAGLGSGELHIYDRLTHKTQLSNAIKNKSGQSIQISANTRYIAFHDNYNNFGSANASKTGMSIHDLLTGKTTQVVNDEASGAVSGDIVITIHSSYPLSFSSDGRYLLFESAASKIVKNDTNKETDIFLYDQVTRKIERVNVSSKGIQGKNNNNELFSNASITPDNRYIVFSSSASNLVAGDTNGKSDLFIRDQLTRKTERINTTNGKQANGGVGGVDGSVPSVHPVRISADGRYVAFTSYASNLVTGDTNKYPDIFIHDRTTHKTERVNVTSKGAQAGLSNPFSMDMDFNFNMSADGRFIAFASSAYMVDGDTNKNSDIFVRDHLLDTHHHADLAITPTTKPITLKPNTTGNYFYTIANNGKDVVPDVSLIHLVSGGSAVSFKPSQGKCTASVIETVCHLGRLAAGQKLTLQATVKAQSTSVNQQITVSGAPVDNVPNNNYISVTTPAR